jgi:Tol biopolymer transport system component
MPSREPVRLTAAGDDPRDVAIAREGHYLVYSHTAGNAHVWRMALHGNKGEQAHTLISSTRIDGFPRYSPDGQRIAFESNRSGNDEIWICQADGTHPVQLTTFRAWAGSPRWSPDGQKIAFDSNAAGSWDIYFISAQRGQAVRLTTSEAQEFRPSWSHDGKWIYYCSTRTQHRQIWKIPSTGGTEVQVTKHGGYVAFESADGEDLYYTKEQELWKMPVRRGDERRVSASLFRNNVAPAKSGIYFLEGPLSAETTVRLQFLDLATQAVKTIAVIPAPAGNEISVSPDERWMLFSKTDREGSELMIVENFTEEVVAPRAILILCPGPGTHCHQRKRKKQHIVVPERYRGGKAEQSKLRPGVQWQIKHETVSLYSAKPGSGLSLSITFCPEAHRRGWSRRSELLRSLRS